ncbi:MAG: 6-phosphogluconolactonase [Marinibacterium sp.]
MKIIDYPDHEALSMGVADALAGSLKTALVAQDHVTIAVAGGTTPGPIFDDLAAAPLDWARVTVLPTDERCVPEGDARSNARLIRDRLLTKSAASARFLSLSPGDDASAAVVDLDARIAPLLPLSVVLLGMGLDMHTASLFPDAPDLAEALAADAPAVTLQHPPSQPEARISLSARVLAGAIDRHLLITGADKRRALERAQNLTIEEAPVRAVLGGTTVHWAE